MNKILIKTIALVLVWAFIAQSVSYADNYAFHKRQAAYLSPQIAISSESFQNIYAEIHHASITSQPVEVEEKSADFQENKTEQFFDDEKMFPVSFKERWFRLESYLFHNTKLIITWILVYPLVWVAFYAYLGPYLAIMLGKISVFVFSLAHLPQAGESLAKEFLDGFTLFAWLTKPVFNVAVYGSPAILLAYIYKYWDVKAEREAPKVYKYKAEVFLRQHNRNLLKALRIIQGQSKNRKIEIWQLPRRFRTILSLYILDRCLPQYNDSAKEISALSMAVIKLLRIETIFRKLVDGEIDAEQFLKSEYQPYYNLIPYKIRDEIEEPVMQAENQYKTTPTLGGKIHLQEGVEWGYSDMLFFLNLGGSGFELRTEESRPRSYLPLDSLILPPAESFFTAYEARRLLIELGFLPGGLLLDQIAVENRMEDPAKLITIMGLAMSPYAYPWEQMIALGPRSLLNNSTPLIHDGWPEVSEEERLFHLAFGSYLVKRTDFLHSFILVDDTEHWRMPVVSKNIETIQKLSFALQAWENFKQEQAQEEEESKKTFWERKTKEEIKGKTLDDWQLISSWMSFQEDVEQFLHKHGLEELLKIRWFLDEPWKLKGGRFGKRFENLKQAKEIESGLRRLENVKIQMVTQEWFDVDEDGYLESKTRSYQAWEEAEAIVEKHLKMIDKVLGVEDEKQIEESALMDEKEIFASRVRNFFYNHFHHWLAINSAHDDQSWELLLAIMRRVFFNLTWEQSNLIHQKILEIRKRAQELEKASSAVEKTQAQDTAKQWKSFNTRMKEFFNNPANRQIIIKARTDRDSWILLLRILHAGFSGQTKEQNDIISNKIKKIQKNARQQEIFIDELCARLTIEQNAHLMEQAI